MYATDEEHIIALRYVGDYWVDCVGDIGLLTALTDPPESYDLDLIDEENDEDYAEIAGMPLRKTLRLNDAMLAAMDTSYSNYLLKVEAQSDDSIAPGANDRYNDQYDLSQSVAHTDGVFSILSSCQGGDEVDLIFNHPIQGVVHPVRNNLLSADEYRARSAPYVAAFGVELYPGDREAGLVHESVIGALS